MDHCPNHQDYERRIARLESRTDAIESQVDELAQSLIRREEQINIIFSMLDEIKKTVKGIFDEVARLKNKPADYWEILVKGIITTAIGVIIGYLMRGMK